MQTLQMYIEVLTPSLQQSFDNKVIPNLFKQYHE